MSLAAVFLIKKVLDFSRRSDDLSVDLSTAFAGMVSGEAIDSSIHLRVQLAKVVLVENSDLVSLLRVVFWVSLVVAGVAKVLDGQADSIEDLPHAACVSASPFLTYDGIDDSLERFI